MQVRRERVTNIQTHKLTGNFHIYNIYYIRQVPIIIKHSIKYLIELPATYYLLVYG